MLRWDDLRFFLAVAETQTLAGAARKLGVNHSTVFRRLNDFEKSAGARLFERQPDGYQLTIAGEELLGHARRIGQEIDTIELKLLGSDYRPRGKLRLTAPERIANSFLPAYLVSFRARYPDIELELDVGPGNVDLTRREADLAVRATPRPPPHLIGRRVVSMPWSYYASTGYLAARGRPERAGDLGKHAFIGADGTLRRLPPFVSLEQGLADRIVMRCSTLNSIAAMAEAGLGIALLPRDQERATLERLFAATPPYSSDLWLLTHPELRRTERIRLAMDHLFAAFREDPRLAELSGMPSVAEPG